MLQENKDHKEGQREKESSREKANRYPRKGCREVCGAAAAGVRPGGSESKNTKQTRKIVQERKFNHRRLSRVNSVNHAGKVIVMQIPRALKILR